MAEYVVLNQILLHPTVTTAVRKYVPEFSPSVGKFKKDPTTFLAPLNRMEEMIALPQELLPPVKLKLRAVVQGIPYYTLQDGRHRLARAIIRNERTILAVVGE